MAGQNQGPSEPKGEGTLEQDLETVESERLAQEHVQRTGREGDMPATGVVSDRGDEVHVPAEEWRHGVPFDREHSRGRGGRG